VTTRRTDPSRSDALIGRVLGGCRIESRIGRGGMGTVYRARHLESKRSVAIKVLAPFLSSEQAHVSRFLREASSASRVSHPHVVRVLGAAEEDGWHFIVLEYVDGESLAARLKREGVLPPGEALRIAAEIARGLRALHDAGIVHRDIKPANVLLGRDGAVRIVDFGVARDFRELSRLTAPGDRLGTACFAAPEQLRGEDVDGRADFYSLGATLYAMLVGQPPPEGREAGCLDALRAALPGRERGLTDFLAGLLREDRDRRPLSAAAVVAALDKHAARFRSRRLPAVAGLGLAGGASLLAWLSWESLEPFAASGSERLGALRVGIWLPAACAAWALGLRLAADGRRGRLSRGIGAVLAFVAPLFAGALLTPDAATPATAAAAVGVAALGAWTILAGRRPVLLGGLLALLASGLRGSGVPDPGRWASSWEAGLRDAVRTPEGLVGLAVCAVFLLWALAGILPSSRHGLESPAPEGPAPEPVSEATPTPSA
jgi:predicted Ser/Thr protein kinase